MAHTITVGEFLSKFKGIPKDANITFFVKDGKCEELGLDAEEYCEFDSVEKNRKDITVKFKN